MPKQERRKFDRMKVKKLQIFVNNPIDDESRATIT
jgi:hypothetical protein